MQTFSELRDTLKDPYRANEDADKMQKKAKEHERKRLNEVIQAYSPHEQTNDEHIQRIKNAYKHALKTGRLPHHKLLIRIVQKYRRYMENNNSKPKPLEDFLCDQGLIAKQLAFLKDYVDNEIKLIERAKEQSQQFGSWEVTPPPQSIRDRMQQTLKNMAEKAGIKPKEPPEQEQTMQIDDLREAILARQHESRIPHRARRVS